MSLSPSKIANIKRIVDTSGLIEVHIEQDGEHIIIGATTPTPAIQAHNVIAITASAAGTISLESKADDNRVATGDHLANLHVLGTTLPIPAPASGRIAAVLIEDGSLVSYGAELFLIEPEETI